MQGGGGPAPARVEQRNIDHGQLKVQTLSRTASNHASGEVANGTGANGVSEGSLLLSSPLRHPLAAERLRPSEGQHQILGLFFPCNAHRANVEMSHSKGGGGHGAQVPPHSPPLVAAWEKMMMEYAMHDITIFYNDAT